MKTENTVPLYKRLNDERTQGEWEHKTEHSDTGCENIWAGNKQICTAWSYNKGRKIIDSLEQQSNVQYTALAVNNLHLLAEALQRLLKEARFNSFTLNGSIEDTPAEKQAAEALNRIS